VLDTRVSPPVVLRGDAHQVNELLASPGALLRGHFKLLAGMHTDRFFRFSAVARDPTALDAIAQWLDRDVRDLAIDSVLAPTTAGVGLGWTLATSLGVPLHLAAVDHGARPTGILGEPVIEGQRILLVNDVVTTGRGLQTMLRLTEERHAGVAAACWFLTRSDVDGEALLGVPCLPIVRWNLPAWDGSSCEACRTGNEPELAYDLN
jgi:orotate phosphoribosyltransferase